MAYSPSLARWVEQDPEDYVDGMNMYQFVSDNPINRVDPSGLYGSIFNNSPLQLYQGGFAHDIIAKAYAGLHEPIQTYQNFTPLSTIVERMKPKPDVTKLGDAASMKPDIMTDDENPKNKHYLYEIKPIGIGAEVASSYVSEEITALKSACVNAELGPVNEPGSSGEVPFMAGEDLVWWSPPEDPGVILYTFEVTGKVRKPIESNPTSPSPINQSQNTSNADQAAGSLILVPSTVLPLNAIPSSPARFVMPSASPVSSPPPAIWEIKGGGGSWGEGEGAWGIGGVGVGHGLGGGGGRLGEEPY